MFGIAAEIDKIEATIDRVTQKIRFERFSQRVMLVGFSSKDSRQLVTELRKAVKEQQFVSVGRREFVVDEILSHKAHGRKIRPWAVRAHIHSAVRNEESGAIRSKALLELVMIDGRWGVMVVEDNEGLFGKGMIMRINMPSDGKTGIVAVLEHV